MDNLNPSTPSPSTQQLQPVQLISLFAFSNSQQEAVQVPAPLTPPPSIPSSTLNSPTQPLQVAPFPKSIDISTPNKINNSPNPFSTNSDKGKTYRRRGRPPLDKSSRVCASCGTTNTGEWRRGEQGPHSLCNACGLQYLKEKKKEKRFLVMQEISSTGASAEESGRTNTNTNSSNNNDNNTIANNYNSTSSLNTEAANNNNVNNTNNANSTSFHTFQRFIPSPTIKGEPDYNTSVPTRQPTSTENITPFPFLTPSVSFPQMTGEYDALFGSYFQQQQQLQQLQQLQQQQQQAHFQQLPQQQQEGEHEIRVQNFKQEALQQQNAHLNALLQQQLILQQQQHLLQQRILQQHLTPPPPTPVIPTPLQLQQIQQLQEEHARNERFLQQLYQYFNMPPPNN